MSGPMKFEFTFRREEIQPKSSLEDDAPLRILVLGNFSGGGDPSDARPRLPLRQRPSIRVDIDNFDAVLSGFSTRLRLGDGKTTSSFDEVEFRELEDFRPERLGEKLPTFRQLHDLRQKLLDPAKFAQAAAQLRQSLMAQASVPERSVYTPSTTLATQTEDDAATLQRILGEKTPSGSRISSDRPADRQSSGVHQLIQQLIQPYIVPAADPQQGVYLAAVDKALGDQMRAVLHSPSFQELEATWRSLHGFIANLDDDYEIQIHLLDVTYEELLWQVPTDDQQLQQYGLYCRLTDDSTFALGTAPWSLIIADFTIAARPSDLTLLGALAATAERLRTPLIAAAHSSFLGYPSLVDCPDPTEWQPLEDETQKYWQALRRSPAASWVGLVLPRVLLRLPYGEATDEVESFEFEEFTAVRRHEDYLWGNPAYLCAGLITQAFAEAGWSMQLASQLDIDDLPAHIYSDDGENKLQPCAEVAFGERATEAILQRGLMPLVSWKDRNAIRFVRFQSIADPLSQLAGPWS